MALVKRVSIEHRVRLTFGWLVVSIALLGVLHVFLAANALETSLGALEGAGGWLGWLVGDEATPDTVRRMTPRLLVPGAVFGIVELFGRAGKSWRDDKVKHIGGAIFWLIAVLVVAGRLQMF